MTSRPWTRHEKRLFAQLDAAGWSFREMTARLDRSFQAIRGYARDQRRAHPATVAAQALPEHNPDAPICASCHVPYDHWSDPMTGLVWQTCSCGDRPLTLKRPANFRRYEGTDQRLAYLAERVTLATKPIMADKPPKWNRAHPFNQKKYGLLDHEAA